MRVKGYAVALVLFTIIILFFGCQTVTIRHEFDNNHKDILLVPFRAPPIRVALENTVGIAEFPLWGGFGSAVVDIATTGKRKDIADIQNERLLDWNPTDVLASECANLIKQSSSFLNNNITIANSRELPGVETLRSKEPSLFAFEHGGFYNTLYRKWQDAAIREWKKRDSTIEYKSEYSSIKADIALESSYLCMQYYVSGDKIEFYVRVMLKLIDINTGNKIVAGVLDLKDFKSAIFEISKIDEQNTELFKEKFRATVRQECAKVLQNMGILSKS